MKTYNKVHPRRKLRKFWPNLTNKEAAIELEKLLVAQNHVCAICQKPETKVNKSTGKLYSLAVDHDHDTGRVRGLLCFSCNIALGKLKDSLDIAKRAVRYLEAHHAGK